jgi:hypothetical protein
MTQRRLFPPLGSIPNPLPEDSLDEACELLAEMLAVAIEKSEEEHSATHEGFWDE